jgi:cytochrome oxidase Cu insertion factor (SCO1/SenC/PrrC family)
MLALLLSVLIPIHGVVLDVAHHAAIVRNDVVPHMIPSEIRRYRLDPHAALSPGDGVDALVDTSTTPWTLRDATASGPFVPGLPNFGRVVPVTAGSLLPQARLIDQQGHLLSLRRAFKGKTLLLSFMFTRCPDKDVCPAISSKFAYLQSHLDPKKFALAEISLDPDYDSPAVLTAYGRNYGTDANMWKLLTGEGATIQRLLNEFGIDSLRVSDSNFIHNDKLFIVEPSGRVAETITTAQWDPDDVVAEALAVSGAIGNPFERFKLSLIAGVAAFCGGSQSVGLVLLELTVVLLSIGFAFAGMWFYARLLWGKNSQ